MLIKLIFQFGKLLGKIEQNAQAESFTVVFDRSVQNIVMKDKAAQERVHFEANDEENNQAADFLWDKYFPKPLFYSIKAEGTKTTEELNELEAFRSLLQKFAYDKESDLHMLHIDDDAHSNIFNLDKFKLLNEYYDYAIFGKEEHIESIANSLVYLRRVETITLLFNELIGYLCNYIKEIRTLRDLLEQQSFFNKDIESLLKAESYMIEMTNTVLKSLALLKIPSRHKTDLLLSQNFTDNFDKMDLALGESLKELANEFHLKKTFIEANYNEYNRLCKAAIDPLSNIKSTYKYEQCLAIGKNIVEKVDSLEDFVFEIIQKDRKNTQISLNCNIKKVDEFNEKYFLLLMEYCALIKEVDEIYLTDYLFKPAQINETVEKKLENFYTDKLMANELKKCLQNYPQSKTDFLIFTETDYFKKVLSVRILRNLLDLSETVKHKSKILKRLYGDKYNVKDELNRIESLYEEWVKILVNPYSNDTLTLEDLLNGKKFKNTFFKRITRSFIGFCKKYYKLIVTVGLVWLLLVLKYLKKRNDH